MNDQPMSRADAEKLLHRRVAEDHDFRRELLADPKAVVAREFDIPDLPDDLTIKVIEESPDEMFLVIPHQVQAREAAARPKTNTKWSFF